MKIKFRLAWFVLFVSAAVAYPSAVRSQSMILENYDQSSVPKNKGGDTYPVYYQSGTEGGPFTTSIDQTSAISGSSLKMTLAGNAIELYAQFNPYTGSGREFAHAYAACGYPPACGNPADWQYNTYTKFRFWVKIPTNAGAPDYSGQGNCQVGLYNKSITNADTTVDEGGGGGHFYHAFSVEPTGTWWQVILNMHPSHERGINHVDPGFIPYITADPSRGGQDPTNTYNYWDVLTRFYLQCNTPAGSVWNLDQMEFYRDPVTEDDIHLASTLTGTYVLAGRGGGVGEQCVRARDANDGGHRERCRAVCAFVAHHPAESGVAVTVHPFFDRDAAEEAARIVELVRAAREEDSAQSIAVLVRNRSHLAQIGPKLKEAGLAFRAVEIEALGHRPVVQDLLSLARALDHPRIGSHGSQCCARLGVASRSRTSKRLPAVTSTPQFRSCSRRRIASCGRVPTGERGLRACFRRFSRRSQSAAALGCATGSKVHGLPSVGPPAWRTKPISTTRRCFSIFSATVRKVA